MSQKPRIAVVGGGVSGIACLWELRNSPYEVHLFESDDRLGGHANTVTFAGNDKTATVDTGFIVFNKDCYPRFAKFLESLKVPLIPTDMSFGVSEDDGLFEWGSTSLMSFIGHWRNLFSPWFWRLLFDIIRFNFFATDILLEEQDESSEQLNGLESIGQYLERMRYSPQFSRYFLVPMVAAPWCIDPEEFSQHFPAKFLIDFMARHGLLGTVTRSLKWHTVAHGSKTYVDAFRESLSDHHHLHLGTSITAVQRHSGAKPSLTMPDGKLEYFDHVVLAVHANQALGLLGVNATQDESDILGEFKTSRNICILHSDVEMLPRRQNAQVAWNCLMTSGHTSVNELKEKQPLTSLHSHPSVKTTEKISLTFDMNKLQSIPMPGEKDSPGRVLVSMNPLREPRGIQRSDVYYHPLFSSSSVLAARRLHEINGTDRISFAGAWMGYGFHEDGFAAGTQVAQQILGRLDRCGTLYGNVWGAWTPTYGLVEKSVRVVVEIVQICVESTARIGKL